MKYFKKILKGAGMIALGAMLFAGVAKGATILFPSGGGTGVGTLPASQLIYGNGIAPVATVATTSASCTGTVTCTPFIVIGPSPIVINGSGGGATGSGTVSTSTPLVAGQVDFSTGVSTIGNDSTFLFDTTFKRLTVQNSTTTYASFITASTTNFIINGQSFNNLLGTGLSNVGGALTNAGVISLGNGTGTTCSGTNPGTCNVNTTQNITNLSNLSTNGLVTTSGGNGTLGVTVNSTGGFVLAMANGVPTWVATTTFSGGLTYSNGNVTCTGCTGGTVTAVNATYPIISSGGTTPTISTGFGTTSTWGIGTNGIVLVNSSGVPYAVASSSLNLPNTALQNSSISTSLTCLTGSASVSLGGTFTLAQTNSIACGGTGLTSYPNNSIITSNADGSALIATGTQLTVGNILATTTADNIFRGSIVLTPTVFIKEGSNILFGGNGANTLIRPDSSGGVIQIQSFAGGTNTYFLDNGNVGVATATPQYLITGFSATAPQLSLSAGAGNPQWVYRNAGGNFYLATTTLDGTATTTKAALSITNGGVYSISTSTAGSLYVTSSGDLYVGPAGGGSGDITQVGDCASGACFDGTQTSTLLTFNNGGNLGTFFFDGIMFEVNKTMAVGTTTGIGNQIIVASSTAGQLGLSAGAGNPIYSLRNAGGNFYLGTTTVDGLSTTTVPALTILNNGGIGVFDSSPDFALETVGTSVNGFFGITKTLDGDILAVTSNGYVGIATSSPMAPLTVVGPSLSDSGLSGTFVINRGIYLAPPPTPVGATVALKAVDYRALEVAPYLNTIASSTLARTIYGSVFNAFTVGTTTNNVTASSTIGVYISGAPIASSTAATTFRISTTTALLIDGGVVTTSSGTVTNAFGLVVYSPSGASNNYSAAFPNGSVLMGTTTGNIPSTLTLVGSGQQLTFGNGTGGNALVSMRNAGNKFFIASTTAQGNATTTPPIMTFDLTQLKIGIGTSSPEYAFHIVGNQDNLTSVLGIDGRNGAAPAIVFRAFGATNGAVQKDAYLAIFGGKGADSSGNFATFNAAIIAMKAEENFTSSANGAAVTIQTAAIGTTGNVEKWRFNNAGQFLVATTTVNAVNGQIVAFSSTVPQITLQPQQGATPWNFRAVGGAFYLATSSPTSSATSTRASFGITVNGTIQLGNYADCGTTNALQISSNSVICGAVASDIRLKKDIAKISPDEALEIALALEPKTFWYKDPTYHNSMDARQQQGFIAQDVEKLIKDHPAMVSVLSIDDHGYYTMDKSSLIPYLDGAIQALDTKINKISKVASGVQDRAEKNWMWIAISLQFVMFLGYVIYKEKYAK